MICQNLKAVRRFLLILVIIHCSSLAAKAELIFGFNTSGTSELTPRTVFEGGTIDIPIYLIQTGAENRLNSIGMFSMGATLSYAYQSGAAGIATPSTGLLAAHWTDTLSNAITVDLVGQTVAMEGLINNIATPVKATNNAILLGTMTFNAGTAGNTTSLSLSLANNSAFINLFVDINETFPENDLIFRTASIQTITAVPEPSSMLLAALSSLVLIGSRTRYRTSQT